MEYLEISNTQTTPVVQLILRCGIRTENPPITRLDLSNGNILFFYIIYKIYKVETGDLLLSERKIP